MSRSLHKPGSATYSSKESQDVFDKVPLVVVQLVFPVVQVGGQVDLFGRPERSLGLLVHLPDLRVSHAPLFPDRVMTRRGQQTHLAVLDREQDKARGSLLQ